MTLVTTTNRASSAPAPGADAPAIVLRDLGGVEVSTAKLAPKPLVLIFGELGHDGVRQACADVLDVLEDPKLAGCLAVPILIVAKDAPLSQLKDEAARGRFPAIVLNDPKRDAFGAYRVLVLPTVVVVDGKGKVVHSMPGFLQRFKDILAESVLVASGKETQAQLDQLLDPKAPTVSHEAVRADRLVHLGAELTRHGLYELAESRYTEANALVPGHVGAKLGLGDLMLRQERLPDAEALYRSVLASNAESIDAQLGIAAVQVRRGGDDLDKAKTALDAILEKDPKQARATYLLGQVQELKGNAAGALAHYKKAAELLLDR
jgi:tetratricopeptide (TPR) repeat protein